MYNFIKILSVIFIFFEASTNYFSCEPIDDARLFPKEGDFYVFTIPENEHNSYEGIVKMNISELAFTVKFDSTAKYQLSDLTDSTNVGDINKLFGFNDCGVTLYNHTHSARFGWRYYYGELQLFSYCYTNRERIYNFLKTIEIDTEYKLNIKIVEDSYLFYIDNKLYDTIERGCTNLEDERYLLFPYFGGDELAPHEIRVYINTVFAL